MTLEIRPVGDDELPAYFEAMTTAFLDRPDVEKVAEEVRPLWNLDQTLAAVQDGRICGTFRTWDTELTVPGLGLLPAGAVSAVTVLPSHRRRGILRRMVAAGHALARDRGDAVSLLYASEYPIYGRFGYGPAVQSGTWVLDTGATGFHGADPGGITIEKPSLAIVDELQSVGDAWRRAHPGEIRRRPYRWEFDLGLRPTAWGDTWKGFLAVHRADGGAIDGFARYRAEQKWELRQPRVTLLVDDFHTLTDGAHAALWRFLAAVDWVSTIKVEHASPSDRLPWLLTNARAARMEDVGDGLWVRLLDVPRALEARTYERSGCVVLEVVDGEATGGRLRVELDASPEGASCRPVDRSPDLTLDASALGAAYLGGVPLRQAVLARGADEHRAGALREAEALLRTADEPLCTTFF
ncbi:MAG TPA: GNAT family N-acetyltransferase [Candidatus Limnocylindrales bacterium]|nr:GNAT family N-acetyltransferase [Candidatus Limnocylindrales bacterium]